jgi:hypothetical protein
LKPRGILAFALTAVGKIVIAHEAIKNIGVPAMTMRFATVRSSRANFIDAIYRNSVVISKTTTSNPNHRSSP